MGLFSRRPTVPARPSSPPPLPTAESIFRDELDFIMDALRRLGVPPGDCQDVAQEVLRAVVQNLTSYDPEMGTAGLRPWLYGIARNKADHYARRVRRHRAVFVDATEQDDHLEQVPAETPSPEEHMQRRQSLSVLDALLQGLPVEQRAVFVAVEVYEMTTLATAESLSIPLGTAKTRLRAAREELERKLKLEQQRESRRGMVVPLSLGALLTQERTIPKVAADVRARLWERLQSTLVPGDIPGAPAPALPQSPPGDAFSAAPPVARAAGAYSVAVPFLMGAALGGAAVFALVVPEPPPPRAESAEARVALTAAPRGAPQATATALMLAPSATSTGLRSARMVTSALPLASALPVGTVASALPVAVSVAPSAPLAGEDADLAEEQALLKVAQVAFDRGDAGATREHLAEHERRFPAGKLSTIRELLWVKLLLREGRRAAARRRADALRQVLRPDSPTRLLLDDLLGTDARP